MDYIFHPRSLPIGLLGDIINAIMKATYQPKKLKRLRKHGFLSRMFNRSGRAVLKRRRDKGRAKLTV